MLPKDKTKIKEYREKLSQGAKDRTPWNKGLKGVQVAWNKGKKGCYRLSVKTKLKIAKKLRGKKKILTTQGKEIKITLMKNRWKDPEYREKMVKAVKEKSGRTQRGVKCPARARLGKLNGRYIDGRTRQWEIVRTQCFKRDNYTCKLCGVRGGIYLNAHHIIDRHHCVDIFNVNNLVTLCRNCHNWVTNIEQTEEYSKYKKLFKDYIKEARL